MRLGACSILLPNRAPYCLAKCQYCHGNDSVTVSCRAKFQKIQDLTVWTVCCSRELGEENHMPARPKANLQANLLKETIDVHQKKRELEDHIRTLDSLHNLLTENAAQREIEAYKTNLEERERHNEARK